MAEEQILSAGLDIGTTTTQMVLSRLTLECSGGYGIAPKVSVTRREILYRSPIRFTVLTDTDAIDAKAAADFLSEQYRAAGVTADQIGTGAVIITGESARKRNAREVIDALSTLAGDFVVAAAGPDLESCLAGRGAGADEASIRTGQTVLNADIGGGTSNLCLFEGGREIDAACADIGGRLICVDDAMRVTKCSPQIRMLAERYGLPIRTGEPVTLETLRKTADLLAEALAQICNLAPMTDLGRSLITNHPLRADSRPARMSFSGGVADCMAHPDDPPFRYGDIGPVLAKAILSHPAFAATASVPAKETVRATVIGAGACSMDVSGSTIACEGVSFPLKNLPVLPLQYFGEEDFAGLQEQIARAVALQKESGLSQGAFYLHGAVSPSFHEVESLANLLSPTLAEAAERGEVFPVIVETDFGKALGQSLRRRLGRGTPVLCLDGIHCQQGDYIDIGAPVGGGIAVPVVVKTLLFHEKEDS